MAMAVPFGAVSLLVPYWTAHFGEGVWPQFLAAYNIPAVFVLTFQQVFDSRIDRWCGLHKAYFWRVTGPMVSSVLFTILVPFVGAGRNSHKGAMLICVAILGLSNASLYTWMYNLTGILSKRLPPALLGGSGFVTLYMAAVSFGTRVKADSDQAKLELYFFMAALAPMVALVLYVIMMLRSLTVGALLFDPVLLGDSLTSSVPTSTTKMVEEEAEEDTSALLAPAPRDRDRSRSSHSHTSAASGAKLAMVAAGHRDRDGHPPSSALIDVVLDGDGEEDVQAKGAGPSYLRTTWPLLGGIFLINALQTGGSALAGAMPSQNNNKELPTYILMAGMMASFIGNETIVFLHCLRTKRRVLTWVALPVCIFGFIFAYAKTRFYLNDALIVVMVALLTFCNSYSNASMYRCVTEQVTIRDRTAALSAATSCLYVGVFAGVGLGFALPHIKV